ncbi:MAG: DUF3597 domain-containing protein [Gemmatirosa sp.]
MSIFGKIWSKITGQDNDTPAAPAAPRPGTGAAATTGSVGSAAPTPGMAASAPSAPPVVDVEAIMLDLEAKSGHKSNWRHSIVDLMSLLGIDNSLAERKALAQELGYTGDMDDSASMNIWLHKQVMQRLAANGGKVPANLLD